MLGSIISLVLFIFSVYILVKSFKNEEYRYAYSAFYTSVILYISLYICFSILWIFRGYGLNMIKPWMLLVGLVLVYYIIYNLVEFLRKKYLIRSKTNN